MVDFGQAEMGVVYIRLHFFDSLVQFLQEGVVSSHYVRAAAVSIKSSRTTQGLGERDLSTLTFRILHWEHPRLLFRCDRAMYGRPESTVAQWMMVGMLVATREEKRAGGGCFKPGPCREICSDYSRCDWLVRRLT